MSDQATSEATTKCICSEVSRAGQPPSVSPACPTTNPYGPAVVRANRSARQAEAEGLLTSGTYGHTSSTSLESAVLTDSLVSRYRALTASLGSTLYELTWKVRVTPSGALIFAQRASAPRTSVSACIGWPTPCQQDGPNGGPAQGIDRLPGAAGLTGWATPAARDWRDGRASEETMGRNARPLNEQAVMLSGWPTPEATEAHPGSRGASEHRIATRAAAGRQLSMTEFVTHQTLNGPARLTASGQVLTGSSAGMENGGQLAPDLPRWLLAFPTAWDDCAAMVTRSTSSKRRSSSVPRSAADSTRSDGDA